MKTANEKILDNFIAHKLFLLQFADGEAVKFHDSLKATEERLEGTLFVHAKRLAVLAPGSKEYTKKRKSLISAIASIRHPIFEEARKQLIRDAKEVVVNEMRFAGEVLENASPVTLDLNKPENDVARRRVTGVPMAGKTLAEWVNSARNRDTLDIVETLISGLGLGDTAEQSVARVMGDQRNRNRASIRKAFNNLEGIAHSMVTHAQTQGTQVLAEENPFVLDQEKFVATLDSGTTFICIQNDQEIFKIGEGAMPPLHFRCRSIRVPFLGIDRLGGRPFDGSSERLLIKDYAKANNLGRITANSRANLPYGHKTRFDKYARSRLPEFVGSDPNPVPYSQWFGSRTKDFQIDVIGVRRTEALRKKKLNINQFIDSRGKLISIDDLIKKGLLDEE